MQLYQDFSIPEISEWADPRKTSDEIAQAILEIAVDWDDAQRIWEEGCDAETEAKIRARAWELADPEEDHLWWGISKEERPT